MMKQVFSITLLFIASFVFSQKAAPKEYLDLIYKAESAFLQKDFKTATLAYTAAFKAGKYQVYKFDFYNAGCAWALAGKPDSAFANLYRIVNPGVYTDYNHIANDFDLISLHQDKRWLPLIKQVMKNGRKTLK